MFILPVKSEDVPLPGTSSDFLRFNFQSGCAVRNALGETPAYSLKALEK